MSYLVTWIRRLLRQQAGVIFRIGSTQHVPYREIRAVAISNSHHGKDDKEHRFLMHVPAEKEGSPGAEDDSLHKGARPRAATPAEQPQEEGLKMKEKID